MERCFAAAGGGAGSGVFFETFLDNSINTIILAEKYGAQNQNPAS
jgi:hypothetical protein